MSVEVQISGVPRTQLDRIVGVVFAHGATGLHEDWMPDANPHFVQPWEDRADPVPDPVFLRAWFDELDAPSLMRALADHGFDDVAIGPVDPKDWQAAAQEHHAPVVISPRLTVAPPWDAPEGALIIEPGRGFGTGAHPTTQLALHRLEALADDHRTLLDVGTGSGVIALAAAKLGLQAMGIDNDPDAVADARRQRQRNAMDVELHTTPVDQLTDRFDLVIANLHGPLLVRLAEPILARTGRTLFITGILPEHEAEVAEAYRSFEMTGRFTDDPWIGRQYRCPTSA
ncbi:MAG: 50S ribosomal protein L11 methyltransferase [Myxococcota bacterium]